MDKIVIHGGERLEGQIRINGAKNAALLIQCAALLGEGKTTLRHVPRLSDVRTMGRLLERLGCQVGGDRTLSIDPAEVAKGRLEAPYELVKTMRASVTVMGPLLARYGRARVSLPGGCAIGARPIDQHLKGLAALGAEIKLSHGYVELTAKRLQGAAVVFDTVTVGGTQNVMMAATLAKGHTRLENVAREPEVQELARFLNKMGAQIRGAGTPVIEIEGVDNLQGIDHAVVPDRIEAGTLAVGAAITGGDVLLQDAPVDDMHAVIAKLQEAGVALHLLVAVVDLAGALLLDDFADHLLAVDPHAEVGDARVLRHGEDIEGFDDPVFLVDEDLLDLGHRDAVVDDDADVVLLRFEHSAETAVGDQLAGSEDGGGEGHQGHQRGRGNRRDGDRFQVLGGHLANSYTGGWGRGSLRGGRSVTSADVG